MCLVPVFPHTAAKTFRVNSAPGKLRLIINYFVERGVKKKKKGTVETKDGIEKRKGPEKARRDKRRWGAEIYSGEIAE